MYEDSIWRTWKPYAVVIAAIAGAMWWYSSQSSFATLKDGDYTCQLVFVGRDGKYSIAVDEAGSPYPAISATVRDGALAEMGGNSPVLSAQLSSMPLDNKGTSHFRVGYDRAPLGSEPGYATIACDYAGGTIA